MKEKGDAQASPFVVCEIAAVLLILKAAAGPPQSRW
jgi:hypothetical protein